MLEVILAALGGSAVSALVLKRRQSKKLTRSLSGFRGGVYLRQPNGSQHPIQNHLEQQLSRQGMALQSLRAEACEQLMKSGEWNNELSTSPIEVAVVGRIVVSSYEPSKPAELRIGPQSKPTYYRVTADIRYYGPNGIIVGAFHTTWDDRLSPIMSDPARQAREIAGSLSEVLLTATAANL